MSDSNFTVTSDRLRSMLLYCPESGHFTWLNPGRANPRLVGARAGGVNSEGYWKISVGGKNYLAHRLVFLFVLGRWPVGVLDHINGDRTDNRFLNLRESSDALNAQNRRKARTGNTSGYLGVSWNSRRGQWVAQIQVDGKKKGLGYFDDPAVAHSVYLTAKRATHAACTI